MRSSSHSKLALRLQLEVSVGQPRPQLEGKAMAVANIHGEEYEVTTRPRTLSSPTRLYFKVKKKNVSGDDPVEEMYLRKYTSGSTRTGREDLEDATARLNLVDDASHSDYTDATTDIHMGSIVSYVSTRQSGVEYISQFTWS
jgi:hypothetical protein